MGTINVGARPSGVPSPIVWRVLSVLALLGMGGIHAFLVLDGVGGVLGALFVIDAIGGLLLAIAMFAVPPRLLLLASLLGLMFLVGTLLTLVLALTVGLLGMTETLSFTLVPTTLVVESIGAVVLAVMTVLAFGMQRRRGGRRSAVLEQAL
jgi:hypothetical protein